MTTLNISTVQLRRGSTAAWESENPILAAGELGLEYVDDSTTRAKAGDGATAWVDLPYLAGSAGIGGGFTGTDFQDLTSTPAHSEVLTFVDFDSRPGIHLDSIETLAGEASSTLIEVALTDVQPDSPDDPDLDYAPFDPESGEAPDWGTGYVLRATLTGTPYGTVVLAMWVDPDGVHGAPGTTGVWAHATDDAPAIADPEWIASGWLVFPAIGSSWPYNLDVGSRPAAAAYQMKVDPVVPGETFHLQLVPLDGRQVLPVVLQCAGGSWSDLASFSLADADAHEVTIVDPFNVITSTDDELHLSLHAYVNPDGDQSWICRLVPASTLT